MAFDMLELRRAPKRLVVPIQLPDPAVQMRVSAADVAQITLEVLHVHGVEADDGREEPDVGFRDARAEVVGSRAGGLVLREMRFGAVERFEELCHCGLVGFLGGGEAGAVDAVVDVVVGPLVGLFDLFLEVGGEEVDGGFGGREEGVEGVVHHANDLGGFVGDDFVLEFVVQGRDGEAAGVVGVDGEVDVAEVREFGVERVWGDVLAGELLVGGCEAPA